jgi:hypothetical protein
LYSSIRFRNKGYETIITHGTPICSARLETEFTISTGPISKTKQRHIIVDDPFELNKNNDCPYFKQTLLHVLISFIKQIFGDSRLTK